jgi:nucleoside-diphosphate-sugar epimerase
MIARKQTAIVTGVTSFVGMHLARRFAADGFSVTATTTRPLDSYSGIQAQRLRALYGKMSFTQLDLRDARAVSALIDQICPSLWLHHAGYTTNYASLEFDLATGLSVNVIPLSALYSALAGGDCGVIITGSASEYSSSSNANREQDLCVPETPYGLSKYSETLYASQLAQRHRVSTRVARLYIPFGSLDDPDKLLMQVVSGLRAGKPVMLSPCDQVRDFIGISDVCSAYVALASDLPRSRFDIFNICSGEPTRLRDLLLSIGERLGAATELLLFGSRPLREGEPMASYGSNEKAHEILGWKQRSLRSAIDCDLLVNEIDYSSPRDRMPPVSAVEGSPTKPSHTVGDRPFTARCR